LTIATTVVPEDMPKILNEKKPEDFSTLRFDLYSVVLTGGNHFVLDQLD
jgi:hypothetical protein